MMKRLWVRFLFYYLSVVLLALTLSSLLIGRDLGSQSLDRMQEELYRSARLFGVSFFAEHPEGFAGDADLDKLCRALKEQTGYRFTVVSAEGVVLGDSDEPARSMENHLYRPEIQEALRSGQGTSQRFSHTVGAPMLYGAVSFPIGGRPAVLRLALPLKETEARLSTLRCRILLWSLCGFLLALPVLYLFSRATSRRIVRLKGFLEAVRRGDRSRRLYVGSGDELGELERALDEVAGELALYVQDLALERTRRGTILQAIQDGIVLLDDEDRVLFINPAAAAIFHVDRNASLGQRLLEVIRSEDLYRLIDETRKEGGQREPREVMLLQEPSRTFLAAAVSLAAPGGAGAIGCLLILRDVTEQKRLDKIRADFIAHVSHELRTPLTLIKGFVETLREEGTQDREQSGRYLSIIGENTDRLVRLVEGLLRLSSIELGRIPIERQPLAVARLVEKAVEMVGPSARDKGLSLQVSIREGLPPLAGDPDRVMEVLLNLLDNAVKYTRTGEIRISAELREPSGDAWPVRVALSVSDTGIGIPARELPRVTERFYRGEGASREEVRGSGLGLAIVKHLVRALDGAMSIESTEPAGTTVTVFLPVWTEQTEGAEQSENGAAGGGREDEM
ncbi:MAG: ATP-binding protein [bacterium]